MKTFTNTNFPFRFHLLLLIAVVILVFPTFNYAAPNPVVAIHVSELTEALETMPAQPPTPTGSGTTGKEWWTTSWHYFVAYESLKEALRADGTAFVTVSDAQIAAGALLKQDGSPAYPIVVSLASEAVANNEIQPLRDYVNSGGFLFVGSSSFTRNIDGTARGDFAIANEMGVHSSIAALDNWVLTKEFQKVVNHRLVNNIPGGVLNWRLPLHSDEIPTGISSYAPPDRNHDIWQVNVSDATLISQASSLPLMTVKDYGSGKFIYYGLFQPILGNGGYDSGMYNYLLIKNAIDWAFESSNVPLVRLSPWQYEYNSAFVVRHDLENFADQIRLIEQSSIFEDSYGASGDYYFCTGTLRELMADSVTVVSSIRRAVADHNASIGSHNGGNKNVNIANIPSSDYFYWHWGPDEALDVVPQGYASGFDYAKESILNSYTDIEGWLAGIDNGRVGCGALNNCPRIWVSPAFNSVRENSFLMLEQLNVETAGEQKISPFPHLSMSTQTPGKKYNTLTLPVSDWYRSGNVLQTLDDHTVESMEEAVDFYYDLGALVNIYGHRVAQAGTVWGEYVAYNSSKPRMWAANSIKVKDWWASRSNVTVTPIYSVVNGTTATIQATISGATDSNTAIEIELQPWARGDLSVLQVFFNGVPANPADYRLTSRGLKLKVGTTVTNVEIRYSTQLVLNLPPVAAGDSYTTDENLVLNQNASGGVLANDSDPENNTLAAQLVNGASHGSVVLNSDGSFVYTPIHLYTGYDSFTYRAADGNSTSNVATVVLWVKPVSNLVFLDDFTRLPNDPNPLLPWTSVQGNWSVANGVLTGSSAASAFGFAYMGSTQWTNYSVTATVQFSSSAYGGGIAGRLNPATGARYSVWMYPEGSPWEPKKLKLIKFRTWTDWSGTPMQQVTLPSVGTGPHSVKLTFFNNRIQVFLDGQLKIDVLDNNFDARPAYLSGNISADMWTYNTPYVMSLDNVYVENETAPNLAPSANNDSFSVFYNSVLNQDAPGVLGNDTDPEGATLTAQLVTEPAHGTLSLNSDGSFVYTPTPGYVGGDSFAYIAFDGAKTSNVATVSLTVNSPPAAITVDDSYSTNLNTQLMQVAPGVLANDISPIGLTLSTELVSGVSHGVLNLVENGSFIYTPDNGYIGYDSFSYRVSDGQTLSNIATVQIWVKPASSVLYVDEFNRLPNEPSPLLPWIAVQGNWAVTGGGLHGTSAVTTYGIAYTGSSQWTDYSVETLIQFPANGFGGGLTGRVNPLTGARYAVWVYPDGSTWGGNVLKLIKFRDWTNWSGAPMQQVALPSVGTGQHHLKLVFVGNQIQVIYDGVLKINITDNNFDLRTPYLNGAVGADMWTNTSAYTMKMDNVLVQGIAANQAPVAVNDSYTTLSNTPINQSVPGILGNDTDPENATLTAQLVSSPAHGVLNLNSSGSFVYTPASGYFGTDTFTYTANDGVSSSNVATVNLTIDPQPTAVNDSYSTNADTQLIIAQPGVLVNDIGFSGSGIATELVGAASHGIVNLNTNGSFTYTPASGYEGYDSFSYRVNNGQTLSNVATVLIWIKPIGSVIYLDDFTRLPGDPAPLQPWTVLQGNWTVTNGLLQGSSVLSTYGMAYAGSSQWADYSVEALIQFPTNGFGGGISGRVNVLTGTRYSVWVYPDGSTWGGNVLKLIKFRDWTNWSGTPMQQVALPSVGTNPHLLKLAFTGNRIQVYYDSQLVIDRLDNNFDLRTPYLTGGISAEMWTHTSPYIMSIDNVVVQGEAVNQAPTAINESYTTLTSTALIQNAPGVLSNDTDPEGNPLTAQLGSGPTHGSLVLNADGSFTYTPLTGYVGTDSFTYTASDVVTNSNTATVNLIINTPPAAANDSYSLNVNNQLIQSLPGVLANDVDADGTALTAELVASTTNGTLVLNQNGSFTYTPNTNYSGTDSFTYRVSDGITSSNVATVTFTVNALPVAVNDAYFVNANSNLVQAAPGILSNDSDPEGATLTAELINGATHGALTLSGNGSFTYTPNANYSGLDTFTYRARDATSNSNTATVTITVNAPPVAVNDVYLVNMNTTLTQSSPGLLANDSDPEGASLTAELVSEPSHGALTLDANGSFSYTPNANYSGFDTFTYRAKDASSNSNTATVTITVNAPPVAANDNYSVNSNAVLNLSAPGVLSNDSDPNGTTLTAQLVTGPTQGTLTLNSNGSFVYTPNANYVGGDTFTYRVSDGNLTSNVVNVTINVVGFKSPTTNAAVTSSSGDNNGFQTTPSNAFVSDSLYAVDVNSGTSTSTSCTSTGKDRHRFYNYGFNLPTSLAISGIEVRLDARVDSAIIGNPIMCVELSWDGGTTWTTPKSTPVLSTTNSTYMLGGATDNWGRTWTVSNLSNTNFRVRITNVSFDLTKDFSLNYVAVRIR